MKEKHYIWLTVIVVVVVLFLAVFFQPYMEARSYNKLTGGNATTWDALWTELRVTGHVSQEEE